MRIVPVLLLVSLLAVAVPPVSARAEINIGINLNFGNSEPQIIYVPDNSRVRVNTVVIVQGRRVMYAHQRDRGRVEQYRTEWKRSHGPNKPNKDRGKGRDKGHGKGHDKN